MTTVDPQALLLEIYTRVQQPDFDPAALSITYEGRAWVQIVVSEAEHHKAIIAALLTSFLKKIETPSQDIRQHKTELEGGYSGRNFDFRYVTPFLQRYFRRLSMAESGWLTRSIEQLAPFTLDFPGRIRNATVKQAFLSMLHDVQVNGADARAYMMLLMYALIQLTAIGEKAEAIQRGDQAHLTVNRLIDTLHTHFFHRYVGAGASRLPVLAIYSAYQLLMETPRYADKGLLPLKNHITADTKSHSVGDIEIVYQATGAFFEAVEVKHNKLITAAMVEAAADKIQGLNLARYYILTTAQPNFKADEDQAVMTVAERAGQDTGCEFILNGIMPSLKYYLRLVPDLNAFVTIYTQNLHLDFEQGTNIKRTHIEQWDSLSQQL